MTDISDEELALTAAHIRREVRAQCRASLAALREQITNLDGSVRAFASALEDANAAAERLQARVQRFARLEGMELVGSAQMGGPSGVLRDAVEGVGRSGGAVTSVGSQLENALAAVEAFIGRVE